MKKFSVKRFRKIMEQRELGARGLLHLYITADPGLAPTEQTIRNWLAGTSVPSGNHLMNLPLLLDCSMEELQE